MNVGSYHIAAGVGHGSVSYSARGERGGGLYCCARGRRLTAVVGAVGRGGTWYLVRAFGMGRISAQSCVLCVAVWCVCEGLTARREGLPAPLSLRPPLAKWNREGGFGVLESWRSTRHGSPGPSNSGRTSREHPSSTGMVFGLSRAKARGEKDRGDQRGHGMQA